MPLNERVAQLITDFIWEDLSEGEKFDLLEKANAIIGIVRLNDEDEAARKASNSSQS